MCKIILAAGVLAITVAGPALAQGGGDMKGMAGMTRSSMTTADGQGVVKAIDAKAGTVTIQHGPIAALKWPAMTMAFKADPPSLLGSVSVGQTVFFQLMQMGGSTTVTSIRPM